jgi:hypothetical protein
VQERHPEASVAGAELFEHDRLRELVGVAAAVFARKWQRAQAELVGAPEEVSGERCRRILLAVEPSRLRPELVLGEAAGEIAELELLRRQVKALHC